MKQKGRRTAGVPWAKWHRMIVLRSLKMMVMSGVVLRADLAPRRFTPIQGGWVGWAGRGSILCGQYGGTRLARQNVFQPGTPPATAPLTVNIV